MSFLTIEEQTSDKHPLATGDVIAAAATLALGIVVLALTLQLQQFAGGLLSSVVVFVFPMPVACGLACGFVAPRRSLVWGAVWACILYVIVLAIAYPFINTLTTLTPSWRLLAGVVGVAIAVIVAVVGEKAVQQSLARKSALLFLVLCAVTVAVGYSVARREAGTYKRNIVPEVILALDRDYLAVPRNAEWQCRPRRELRCYELVSSIGGQKVTVYADPKAPLIVGVDFQAAGHVPEKWDCDAAQTYLAGLGFRPALVKSVLQRRGERGPWFGGIEFTRIVLSRKGIATLKPYPPFESRAVASHRK